MDNESKIKIYKDVIDIHRKLRTKELSKGICNYLINATMHTCSRGMQAYKLRLIFPEFFYNVPVPLYESTQEDCERYWWPIKDIQSRIDYLTKLLKLYYNVDY